MMGLMKLKRIEQINEERRDEDEEKKRTGKRERKGRERGKQRTKKNGRTFHEGATKGEREKVRRVNPGGWVLAGAYLSGIHYPLDTGTFHHADIGSPQPPQSTKKKDVAIRTICVPRQR